VPSSGIIDLAIGLTFVFGVTAAASSVVTELIARFLGLRGAYLLTGLRELIDSGEASTDLAEAKTAYNTVQDMVRNGAAPSAQPSAAQPLSATSALLGGPILGNQGMSGDISSRKLTLPPTGQTRRLPKLTAPGGAGIRWRLCRSLPSYISATSFADAVIDLVVPNAADETTMTTIQKNVNALPDSMSPFKSSLQALVKSAGDDIGRFRTAVERWYDDHMDRVSGWYKRHVAKVTLVVGAILVVLFNINALTIGRTLYTESSVSTAVAAVAAKGPNCPTDQTQACLENLQAQLSAAATAGLPIGWGTVRDCTESAARCNWLDQRGIFSRYGDSGWQFVLVLTGFLIMLIAIVPGARFWFGLLSKLGSLRATGPKPAGA